MHNARVGIFLFAGLFLLSTCPARSGAEVVFHEDFDGPVLDPARWKTNPGGGSLTFGNGRLVLAAPCGAQFPSITTAGNPFPTEGDFLFRVGFRYVDVQQGGNGFYAPNGFVYGGRVEGFQVWQDYCCANGIIAVVGDVQVHLTSPPDTAYHTYEWLYVDGVYTFRFDGRVIVSDPSPFRPTGILFGHPPYNYCPWTTQEIDYVHIEASGGTPTRAGTWGSIKVAYR